MSDPNKKRPRKSRAKKAPSETGGVVVPLVQPTPVEDPTLSNVCEKAARIVDGLVAEQGWRAIVIVYEPQARSYQADWRGSVPDIASMICLRAGFRIMGQIG